LWLTHLLPVELIAISRPSDVRDPPVGIARVVRRRRWRIMAHRLGLGLEGIRQSALRTAARCPPAHERNARASTTGEGNRAKIGKVVASEGNRARIRKVVTSEGDRAKIRTVPANEWQHARVGELAIARNHFAGLGHFLTRERNDAWIGGALAGEWKEAKRFGAISIVAVDKARAGTVEGGEVNGSPGHLQDVLGSNLREEFCGRRIVTDVVIDTGFEVQDFFGLDDIQAHIVPWPKMEASHYGHEAEGCVCKERPCRTHYDGSRTVQEEHPGRLVRRLNHRRIADVHRFMGRFIGVLDFGWQFRALRDLAGGQGAENGHREK
jgi:hypothetical protein